MPDVRLPVIDIIRLTREAPPPIPYGVKMIGAELEWGETRGTGIKVGVLDTGVPDHPDLHVTDYVDKTGSGPQDRHGHATHCCGIIAANGAIKGVAPEAQLYVAKVLNDNGQGDWTNVINGLRWCRERGVDVVSMSFGGSSSSPEFHSEIKRCQDAGMVVIAAAGNRGNDGVGFPAGHPEVVAVAAVDIEKKPGDFSSVGPEVELAAAGVQIYSTYLHERYALLSGTSMACPHIAGAVAILQGKAELRFRQRLSPRDIRLLLNIYAEDLGEPGRDPRYGFGVFSFGRFETPDISPREVVFEMDEPGFWVNGRRMKSVLPPRTVDGEPVVACRDLASAFGVQVIWRRPKLTFKG